MTPFDIDGAFTYHAPKGNQAERYTDIRAAMRETALVADQHVPDSPEKTIGFRKLQEAAMMFNLAIAVNEARTDGIR